MKSIARIIDALYRDPDETVEVARVDIGYTESETMIEIGPHAGFTSGSMVVVFRHGAGEHLSQYELEFCKNDTREARALAAALAAWAVWADEQETIDE
jgi:hypothetical protein